jgi:competence protein ComEC
MMLFWVPGVNSVLGWCLEWTLWGLNEVLLWLEHWPHAVLDGFVITPGQVLALYILIITGVLFLVQKRLSYLAVSVLCLAFFTGTELAQAHRQRRNTELVIHSVRRSSAVSMVQGRQVTFLADSAFKAQPTLFFYQVQPYWWAKGVRLEYRFDSDFAEIPPKQVPIAFTPEGNKVLVWRGKKLLWLRKLPRHVPQNTRLDAVVLQHNVWAPVDKLKTVVSTHLVILDQTNSRGYVSRKAAELRSAGYQVHVLQEEGAWQIRL